MELFFWFAVAGIGLMIVIRTLATIVRRDARRERERALRIGYFPRE